MKLEEVKKLQNVFKSNLTKISRGRYRSEEQRVSSMSARAARDKVFDHSNFKILMVSS